jgi:hypothetical protein
LFLGALTSHNSQQQLSIRSDTCQIKTSFFPFWSTISTKRRNEFFRSLLTKYSNLSRNWQQSVRMQIFILKTGTDGAASWNANARDFPTPKEKEHK